MEKSKLVLALSIAAAVAAMGYADAKAKAGTGNDPLDVEACVPLSGNSSATFATSTITGVEMAIVPEPPKPPARRS